MSKEQAQEKLNQDLYKRLSRNKAVILPDPKCKSVTGLP